MSHQFFIHIVTLNCKNEKGWLHQGENCSGADTEENDEILWPGRRVDLAGNDFAKQEEVLGQWQRL